MGSVKRWAVPSGFVSHIPTRRCDTPVSSVVLASDYDAKERACEELRADRDKLAAKVERAIEEARLGRAAIGNCLNADLALRTTTDRVIAALADEEHPDFGAERRKGERRIHDVVNCSCPQHDQTFPLRRSGRDRRGAK